MKRTSCLGKRDTQFRTKREERKNKLEFKITELQLPGRISFNYDELKEALTARVADYKTMVYTDDQIAIAKKDRAELNKLKKALTDEYTVLFGLTELTQFYTIGTEYDGRILTLRILKFFQLRHVTDVANANLIE